MADVTDAEFEVRTSGHHEASAEATRVRSRKLPETRSVASGLREMVLTKVTASR